MGECTLKTSSIVQLLLLPACTLLSPLCRSSIPIRNTPTCRPAAATRFVRQPFCSSKMPNLKLGDVVPNFDADTTDGKINFHEWIGDSWAVLFSHPADYTPVCTTELGRVQKLSGEFQKRGIKLTALSCDSVESHKGWIEDIKAYNKLDAFSYPIIADPDRSIANTYGMMDPDEMDSKGLPLTCCAVFVIGPDKKLKLSILYPATTGRNFDELLRVIDSLHLTAQKKVATPADWQSGGSCMVVPSVKPDEVAGLFPKGVTIHDVPSGKQYIRTTPQP